MNNIATIEDLLETLAGLTQAPKMHIDTNDITIMYSIAKQVFKGTPLTDRQYALMKEKLLKYRDQFVALDCDFDYAIDQLRNPLRQIDRSKYIKLIDNEIKVRFPFRKSEIMEINSISSQTTEYRHDKGSHEHFFGFTETNLLNVIDAFIDKNFVIDEELLDAYDLANKIRNSPENYLSGVFNSELKNIHKNLKPYIESNNTLQLIDKKFKYGFNYVDDITANTLEEKIATRKTMSYHSKPSSEQINYLLSAMWNLDRFPMIVILEKENCENQIYELLSYYRDILDTSQQSVLFREEASDSSFNQLIKDKKLNNWVDKDTKIVYISNNKLPKIIVNNEWKPTTAFCYTSRPDRYIDSYISFNCDLIVYREEDMSPFRKYSRLYG